MCRPILTNRKVLYLGSVTFLLLVVAAAYLFRGRKEAGTPPPPEFGPPPLSDTPFLNASVQAAYVGVDACAGCHASQYQSYLETAHSRALSEIDVAAEPPDADFFHPLSGRRYEVYRDGTQLWHRETVKDDAGGALITAAFPVRYLIGSGRHTRSYLVEERGFLMESPLTWYASRQEWALSPGFDRSQHWGFERATDIGCLICHVGDVESPDRTYQKPLIREQAIGCERCHGPGSLHVAERSAARGTETPAVKHGGGKPRTRLGDGGAATIVHPGRLTRKLGEAICAQCHLRGDATVAVRGRGLTGFRPGLPLTDFRIDYHLEVPDSRMKVVGHVEQMHQSRCYIESETLTCTTCHDPHASIPVEKRRPRFNQICGKCHAEGSCGVDPAERLRQNAANDCVACHMPQVATDIPHIAFTHHRIGVHSKEPWTRPSVGPGAVVAFDDGPHLPQIDRDRNLGLAWLEVSEKQPVAAVREAYRARAVSLLEGVRGRGLNDPEVTAALARIAWEHDPRSALRLAREALQSQVLSPRSRVNSLFVAGDAALRVNQTEAAVAAFEELVGMRRHSEDWLLLGLCRQRSGDLQGTRRDLERAAAIAPFRPEIREALAAVHEQLGNSREAASQRALAERLSKSARPSR
ncbi:MAG: cytochrome c3 family protein [Deltaproteobacteria bacterium]